MDTWADGIFGSTAAQALMEELAQMASREGVSRRLEAAFDAYTAWDREAKAGVAVVSLTPEEVEKTIVQSRVPGKEGPLLRRGVEQAMREAWAQPVADDGDWLAGEVLAAAALVVASATGEFPGDAIDAPLREALADFRPDRNLVKRAQAVLDLASRNPARLKHVRRWPALTAAVLDALRALPP